ERPHADGADGDPGGGGEQEERRDRAHPRRMARGLEEAGRRAVRDEPLPGRIGRGLRGHGAFPPALPSVCPFAFALPLPLPLPFALLLPFPPPLEWPSAPGEASDTAESGVFPPAIVTESCWAAPMGPSEAMSRRVASGSSRRATSG